jgi:ABC-type branched-subunit amino acid transport system substrate-binding protein
MKLYDPFFGRRAIGYDSVMLRDNDAEIKTGMEMMFRTPGVRRATRLVLLMVLVCGRAVSTVSAAENQGITKDEILLGSVLDLSGPVASIGVPVREGQDMAIQAANEAGGINGRKIRIIYADSGYDPKKAIIATQKLVNDDRVFAFVGQLGAAIVRVTMPIIVDNGALLLFPNAPLEEVYQPTKPLAFTVQPAYNVQARLATSYTYNTMGKRKFCAFYQDDDSGEQVLRGINEALDQVGAKLVEKTSYKRGATDFSSQFARMKQADCDIVMFGALVREAAAAALERQKIGWNVDMLVSQPSASDTVIRLAGAAAEGMLGVNQMLPLDMIKDQPNVAPVFKAYADGHGGKLPDPSFLYGYNFMNLFIEAARRTGPDLTTQNFVKTLEQFRDFDLNFGMAPATFSATQHVGTFSTNLLKVTNGQWTRIGVLK